MESSGADAEEAWLGSRSSSPIVVRYHADAFDATLEGLASCAQSVFVVASDDDKRPVDLILWSLHEIDERSVRAVIMAHHPTPVFIVLAATMQPVHVAQCLRLGAVQCLIDPTDRELVAHLLATVRRLRLSDRGPDEQTPQT